ncbi:TPA: undecaprenyl-diphosphatase [Klebsiella aerogenes]|uniref:undecaprenyl-diphosphatase n=1 Tax=Klebsiella aerogenes TaxID=548 RepID=UPI002FE80B60|nr:undecaprenyl-diphosphatase [Klebsiella aerogenes]
MNLLETFNQNAFLTLNAGPGTPDSLLLLAQFSASWLILIVPAILLGLWFLGGRQGHRQALFCAMTILIALGLGVACGTLWFHPRPFMMPLGHTWISHPADNSFPSDHGTVMFSAAFALLSLCLRGIGLLVLAAALPVAWARIFLGVHFPLDMLGAALISALSLCVAKVVWQRLGQTLVALCEALSRRLFSWLPARFTP